MLYVYVMLLVSIMSWPTSGDHSSPIVSIILYSKCMVYFTPSIFALPLPSIMCIIISFSVTTIPYIYRFNPNVTQIVQCHARLHHLNLIITLQLYFHPQSFFSRKVIKSNLKRTKSVTKLDRKRSTSSNDSDW